MGEQVAVRNTICPDCEGSGERLVPRAVAGRNNRGGTAMVTERCKTCDGHGRRAGFQAPV